MDTTTLPPIPSFSEVSRVVSTLEEHEWKPCISIVRYGVIPSPADITLLNKIPDSLFDKFFNPTKGNENPTLRHDGQIFFGIATRPLLSSIIISLILARIPSKEYIESAIIDSISKEISVMESSPKPATIPWEHFFDSAYATSKVVDECAPNPRLHKTILSGLYTLRRSYFLKLLWPYSTMRGVSTETARMYDGETISLNKPWYRPDDESSVVSSRDVVSLYLHHGLWVGGDCELKQRWYPSGLTPRTYFSQGGDAIRVSTYLRDFFNDVCDTFLPTNRFARVDGSRLITYENGYFYIYDLTSFTSNFHEQRPFLTKLSNFFTGVPVLCVETGLELFPRDLGEMIAEYTDVINTDPRYKLNPKLFPQEWGSPIQLVHHTAGFLGVPGNLASCTFAHGILISQHTCSEENQSCAGDDGNVACKHPEHEGRIVKSISRLGIFQTEKGSSTKDNAAASYLKRRFLQNGRSGFLIDRVEYLILSVVNSFHVPDPRFEQLSKDRSKLRCGVAASVASLFRSLYSYTNGVYLDGELDLILDFLSYVYSKVELPRKGEMRGMLLDDTERNKNVDGVIVFPLEERFFRDDPDLLFADMFCPWVVVVPETTDVECSDFQGSWLAGEERICRLNSTLEKLKKYGWLDRKQTPKKVLVGPDAKKYFRRLLRDEIISLEYEYTALIDLSESTLSDIGIYEYSHGSYFRPAKRQKVFHKTYVDEDDPIVLSLRMTEGIRADETPESYLGALSTAALNY